MLCRPKTGLGLSFAEFHKQGHKETPLPKHYRELLMNYFGTIDHTRSQKWASGVSETANESSRDTRPAADPRCAWTAGPGFLSAGCLAEQPLDKALEPAASRDRSLSSLLVLGRSPGGLPAFLAGEEATLLAVLLLREKEDCPGLNPSPVRLWARWIETGPAAVAPVVAAFPSLEIAFPKSVSLLIEGG
jgi:hypothetical protein